MNVYLIPKISGRTVPVEFKSQGEYGVAWTDPSPCNCNSDVKATASGIDFNPAEENKMGLKVETHLRLASEPAKSTVLMILAAPRRAAPFLPSFVIRP